MDTTQEKNKQENVKWLEAETTAFFSCCVIHSCYYPSTDNENCLMGSESPTEKLYLTMYSNKLGIMFV